MRILLEINNKEDKEKEEEREREDNNLGIIILAIKEPSPIIVVYREQIKQLLSSLVNKLII